MCAERSGRDGAACARPTWQRVARQGAGALVGLYLILACVPYVNGVVNNNHCSCLVLGDVPSRCRFCTARANLVYAAAIVHNRSLGTGNCKDYAGAIYECCQWLTEGGALEGHVRKVTGVVEEQGQLALHTWLEYWDRGWRPFEATAYVPDMTQEQIGKDTRSGRAAWRVCSRHCVNGATPTWDSLKPSTIVWLVASNLSGSALLDSHNY